MYTKLFIYCLLFFALLEEQNGGAFCFNIFTVPAQTIINGIYLK